VLLPLGVLVAALGALAPEQPVTRGTDPPGRIRDAAPAASVPADASPRQAWWPGTG
jgi:hypothetical protein